MNEPLKPGAFYWVIKHYNGDHHCYVDKVRIVEAHTIDMYPARIIYSDDAERSWHSYELYDTEEKALKDLIDELDGYIDEEEGIIEDACSRLTVFRNSKLAAESRLEELNNKDGNGN